jgi:hypothetical protein
MACNEITAEAPKYTATIAQGDSWPLRLTFKTGGATINVSGWTFTATAKRGASTVSLGVSMTNAASGIVDFELSAGQSAAMSAGDSAADLAGRWIVNITGTDTAARVRRQVSILLQILK